MTFTDNKVYTLTLHIKRFHCDFSVTYYLQLFQPFWIYTQLLVSVLILSPGTQYFSPPLFSNLYSFNPESEFSLP